MVFENVGYICCHGAIKKDHQTRYATLDEQFVQILKELQYFFY
jgi:hypothetical protein